MLHANFSDRESVNIWLCDINFATRDADISAKNKNHMFREFITDKRLGISERDKQHMVYFLLYFHSDFFQIFKMIITIFN